MAGQSLSAKSSSPVLPVQYCSGSSAFAKLEEAEAKLMAEIGARWGLKRAYGRDTGMRRKPRPRSRMSRLSETAPAFTLDQYLNVGIDPFLRRVPEYFAGNAYAPVLEVSDSLGGCLYVWFSDAFLGQFLTDARLQKAYEVTIKYGFRGFSAGGKNGIFLQRTSDTPLLRATDDLISKNAEEIASVLRIEQREFATLRRVKVVYHNKARVRLVGVLNDKGRAIIFLGTARHV